MLSIMIALGECHMMTKHKYVCTINTQIVHSLSVMIMISIQSIQCVEYYCTLLVNIVSNIKST